MELLIIVALGVAVIGWFLWKDSKFEETGKHPLDGATKAPEPWPFPTSRPTETTTKPDGLGHESIPVMPTLTNVLDVNKDGKVDLKDAVTAVKQVKETATTAADLNKDGKVDLQDAKVAVQQAKEKTKKVAKKAKDVSVEVVEKVKKSKKAKNS